MIIGKLLLPTLSLPTIFPQKHLTAYPAFLILRLSVILRKVENNSIIFSGRPRDNPAYPLIGIFGQRKKDRPNRIGLATVELLEHTGRIIKVKFLDAINGTPVLDIKPVFKEFQPKTAIKQSGWVADLMKDYRK